MCSYMLQPYIHVALTRLTAVIFPLATATYMVHTCIYIHVYSCGVGVVSKHMRLYIVHAVLVQLLRTSQLSRNEAS